MKPTLALLGLAVPVSLLLVALPIQASASCIGASVGPDCYGVITAGDCRIGTIGVGHANDEYSWCYASFVNNGRITGVCSNVEFQWEITCVGVVHPGSGNCIGTQTYGGDGTDEGYNCLIV